MNIDQIKAMMEIQALRQFNTKNNLEEDNSFSLIFQELLQSQSSSFDMLNPSVRNNGTYISVQDVKYTNRSEGTNEELKTIIEKAADTYKLPIKLIEEVIRKESNFNVRAVSHAGASGLMQLMPSTAKSLGVKNIFDPFENVMAGSKYLRNMLDKYNGNLELALAAYNAGPGNVEKYQGIPPFEETRKYVRSILSSITETENL